VSAAEESRLRGAGYKPVQFGLFHLSPFTGEIVSVEAALRELDERQGEAPPDRASITWERP
jgi:hypothetical protein